MINKPFVAINIVPTGIGASIGGFAGDGAPANSLLAGCVDFLISNTNVVNAATIHNIPDNLLYTEGYSIDSFCKGKIALRPSKNKIGVVFDKSIPQEVLNININAINACISVYGINIIAYSITEEPVGVEYYITEDGFSSGRIKNTATLLKACSKLIEKGATAIAVVCMFTDYEEEDKYSKGVGVDPVGGVEAIISHLVSCKFTIPCAHAPAFSYNNCLPAIELVAPETAAEYFSPTFLPCIIAGLSNAPQLIEKEHIKPSDITINDVQALITPYDCLGSVPVICCIEKDIPVIAIKSNKTVLNVTAEKLGIQDKVIISENYLEACGYLMALKLGILPGSVLRPIQQVIGI